MSSDSDASHLHAMSPLWGALHKLSPTPRASNPRRVKLLKMTRRQLLSIPVAGFLNARRARPQATFPGVAYRDYSRCLPDSLRDLAERAYRLRNAQIDKLTTPEAIRKRQAWVHETFWKLTGGMPERTPLNPRTTGSFERPGYRLEKILYESSPEFHIPANLYVPVTARPPFPGVLFQMGHSFNGKAYDSYQRCCQALVKLGYLVLAFDPMGQGERVYYLDSSGTRTRLASSDDEHTVPGKQMLLLGDTASRLQVWDAIRSLDYLAAHPQVDPKRLASVGQSGGGTLTMLLAAVDDRLAAAVVCDGNTENFACASFNPPGSTDDAEQNFLGSAPLGFDRWDLLYPLAPKPLLVTVSDKDFFGTYSSQYIGSGWEEYRKLTKVYDVLKHPDHLAWASSPLPHGLSYDTRLQVYNWFGRWLKGDTKPLAAEPAVAPEPDAALWVTETGNVVRSLHGRTPFTINKARSVPRSPAALDRLLGVERPPAGLRATVLRRIPSRGVDIEALEIPSAPKVWIPAWLFLPKRTDGAKPLVIALEPAGRNVRWREGELYQLLAADGYVVCVPDLRGVGDLAPEFGRGAARYARSHNEEEDYAWASLILGKPLLGQRVTDILAVVEALRNHRPRVVIAAQGKMTIPAQFAAALDPGISALYLTGGLVSYRSIVDTEQYNHPFANFVPHLLRHTDLPDLVGSLAPRHVVLAGPVEAAGHPLDPAVVQKLYANASNAEVVAAAEWDPPHLLPALRAL